MGSRPPILRDEVRTTYVLYTASWDRFCLGIAIADCGITITDYGIVIENLEIAIEDYGVVIAYHPWRGT